MGGMPDVILKPTFLRRLDEVAHDMNHIANEQDRYKAFAAALTELYLLAGKSKQEFIRVARDNGLVRTPDEEAHLADDWLGEEWWKDSKIPIAVRQEVLRKGFIKACEQVRDLRLDLDSYWVCAGPRKESAVFQSSVSKSSQQLTLMLHTPQQKEPKGAPNEFDFTTWIVLGAIDANGNATGPVDGRYVQKWPEW